MQMKPWKLFSLSGAACLAGGAVWGGYELCRNQPSIRGEVRSPGGPGPGAESEPVQGDPANAEKDFRVLYRALDKFRHEHGRFPSFPQLLGTKSNDFRGIVPSDAWTNPDTISSEGPDPQKRASGRFQYMISFAAARADGTRKPAFPKPGERDVWLVAGQYARENVVILPNHRSRRHLQGCYVVLWSDGKIERIPTRERLVAPVGKRAYFVFRGEAGVPKGVKPVNVVDYWRSRNQVVDSD